MKKLLSRITISLLITILHIWPLGSLANEKKDEYFAQECFDFVKAMNAQNNVKWEQKFSYAPIRLITGQEVIGIIMTRIEPWGKKRRVRHNCFVFSGSNTVLDIQNWDTLNQSPFDKRVSEYWVEFGY
ncbi:MAG: hypothetical protein H8E12_01785 [Rhodobacteraceae bacterium]|nr:hypothetical protein [Paracoccaceae bacterium]